MSDGLPDFVFQLWNWTHAGELHGVDLQSVEATAHINDDDELVVTFDE